MKRSWIKLYVELLDDAKMLALPKAVKWDYVQFLLVAAEGDGTGMLPDERTLALRVRASVKDVAKSLHTLAGAGVACKRRGRWYITRFADRQAAMSEADRSREYRNRHTSVTNSVTKSDGERHDADVTDSSSSSPSVSVSDSLEGGGVGEGVVFREYEQNIGVLSPNIADRLGAATESYGLEWVVGAIHYATGQEKRSLAYVEGVLRGWKRDGLTTVPKNGAKRVDTTEDVIRRVANAIG